MPQSNSASLAIANELLTVPDAATVDQTKGVIPSNHTQPSQKRTKPLSPYFSTFSW